MNASPELGGMRRVKLDAGSRTAFWRYHTEGVTEEGVYLRADSSGHSKLAFNVDGWIIIIFARPAQMDGWLDGWMMLYTVVTSRDQL